MGSKIPTENLIDILKNDPDKLAAVMQLLSQSKETGQPLALAGNSSVKKAKQKVQYESPTALMRRRQLEKRDGLKATLDTSSEDAPPSSLVPFNELLKGVVAFVEVRGKGGDRSNGAKALMRTMGAEVLDTFTSRVTHVVFKEGSFNTYQKAKLLGTHLVSVLWLEALKTKKYRVPEKNYPALGTKAYDTDLSLICDKIQKEYQDITSDRSSRSSSCRKLFKPKKTNLPDELRAHLTSGNHSGGDSDDNIIAASQECDAKSCVSNSTAVELRKRRSNQDLDTSDSDSEVACVNGERSQISRKDQHSKTHLFNSGCDSMELTDIVNNSNKENSSSTSNSIPETQPFGNRSSSQKQNIQTQEMSPLLVSSNSEAQLQGSKDSLKTSDLSSLRLSTGTTSSKRSSRSSNENPTGPRRSSRISLEAKTKISQKDNPTSDIQTNEKTSDKKETKKRKSEDSIETSLDNKNSDEGHTEKTVVKRRRKRRLFNIRDSIDSTIFDNPAFNRSDKSVLNSTKVTFKVPIIPLTPVLLSKNAARIVENYRKKNSNVEPSTSPPKTNSKPKRLTKNFPKIKRPTSPKTNKKKSVSPVRKSPRLVEKSEDQESSGSDCTVSKNISERSGSSNNSTIPIIPIVRRSTFDFVSIEKLKKTPVRVLKKGGIVCTRLHRPEVAKFTEIVGKLGEFTVENNVTLKTTHLVAGEPKRTINLLKALARGLWILKIEWLHDSLEEGKWLPEEDYELTEFSPAVQKCRIERQAFGSSYRMNIFEGLGPIYVNRNTDPKHADLQELIKLCSGLTTNVLSKAKIIIGEYVRDDDVTCVTPLWILDSISANCKKPFEKYLIKNSNSPTF